MRCKLSTLSGFVHMRGHLPCHGHSDRTLAVYKLVGRCVCVSVCVCVCEYEEDDMDLHCSHLTPCTSLLELDRREPEREQPNSQRCWGIRNRLNMFINTTGGPMHRLLAGSPRQYAVTELSAGFLWTVCNYLISESIECSTLPCQMESTTRFTALDFKLVWLKTGVIIVNIQRI